MTNTKIYNKLIRDNIPEIIEKDKKSCFTTVLSDEQFKVELKKKLIEESKELSIANTKDDLVNELADIHGLLDNIRETYGITQDEVIAYQQKKVASNGKFDKKLFLISVEENHE